MQTTMNTLGLVIIINGIDDKGILKSGTFYSLRNIFRVEWMGSKFRKTVNVCATQKEPNMSRVDHEGRSCLHYASIGGHLGCVQLLLDHRAPVHLKDKVYNKSISVSIKSYYLVLRLCIDTYRNRLAVSSFCRLKNSFSFLV